MTTEEIIAEHRQHYENLRAYLPEEDHIAFLWRQINHQVNYAICNDWIKEFGSKEHTCQYCGAITSEPDIRCWAHPDNVIDIRR